MPNVPEIFAYAVVGILVLGTISVICIIFTLIRLANARSNANLPICAEVKPDMIPAKCVTSINPDGSLAVARELSSSSQEHVAETRICH